MVPSSPMTVTAVRRPSHTPKVTETTARPMTGRGAGTRRRPCRNNRHALASAAFVLGVFAAAAAVPSAVAFAPPPPPAAPSAAAAAFSFSSSSCSKGGARHHGSPSIASTSAATTSMRAASTSASSGCWGAPKKRAPSATRPAAAPSSSATATQAPAATEGAAPASASASPSSVSASSESSSRDPRTWTGPLKAGCDAPLLYKDFYAWQEDYLVSELGATRLEVAPGLAYQANGARGARVASACYESDLFRKIRMTYFDGGDKVQVFNSLWYPRDHLGNQPLLGVDLLCFGGTKVLAVVDCQPLQGRFIEDAQSEAECAAAAARKTFAAIRDAYPSLSGTMSDRFYDANQFFSEAMLYGRFDLSEATTAAAAAGEEDGEGGASTRTACPIETDLMPAFQAYATAYAATVQAAAHAAADAGNAGGNAAAATPATPAAAATPAAPATPASPCCPPPSSWVLSRQASYDQYSAERDPAHALFKGYFGEPWASDYMHDFLFELSDRKQTAAAHAAQAAAAKAPRTTTTVTTKAATTTTTKDAE